MGAVYTPDLMGQRFGRLEVIAEVPKENFRNGRRWLCRCDCGKEVVRAPSELIGNNGRKSCGCGIGRQFASVGSKAQYAKSYTLEEKRQLEKDRKARADNMAAIRQMVKSNPNYGQMVARRAMHAD